MNIDIHQIGSTPQGRVTSDMKRMSDVDNLSPAGSIPGHGPVLLSGIPNEVATVNDSFCQEYANENDNPLGNSSGF